MNGYEARKGAGSRLKLILAVVAVIARWPTRDNRRGDGAGIEEGRDLPGAVRKQ